MVERGSEVVEEPERDCGERPQRWEDLGRRRELKSHHPHGVWTLVTWTRAREYLYKYDRFTLLVRLQ
jgi:hypothetical protein